MKKLTIVVAASCIAATTVLPTPVFAQAVPAETKYVMVDGEVVRYQAGSVIVIRGADGKDVHYTLSPRVVVPADVKVGRRVSLYTEPGKDGKTQLVSRITTTSITSQGNVQRTTEDTRTLPSGAVTRTTTTDISGKVEAYEAGKTLTIIRSDGSKATYVINEKSAVPADLAVGKSVAILPLAVPGESVIQTVTYVITTKTEPSPAP